MFSEKWNRKKEKLFKERKMTEIEIFRKLIFAIIWTSIMEVKNFSSTLFKNFSWRVKVRHWMVVETVNCNCM